ncbi:deoxyribose-phosphate aldolase [bacterium]|nr:deoxyribose-phosphate aldolase [bacterium]
MSKDDSHKWARMIDHTMLNAQRKEIDIMRICEEALRWDFYSVCVNPKWIKKCAGVLAGSNTIPISVVGFPLGANTSAVKVFEAKTLIEDGAKEIDMVLDIGAAVDDNWKRVCKDIQEVAQACNGLPLKVILETAYLNKIQIKEACTACMEHGASFVKTSTGFASQGAEIETVRFMRECVGPHFGVKASGGIKNFESLLSFVEAGANRIGTSASNLIMKELNNVD